MYNSELKIRDTVCKLNDIFFETGNSVSVLDFSHFIQIDNIYYNVQISLYGKESSLYIYDEILNEEVDKKKKKKEPIWQMFSDDFVKKICNYENSNTTEENNIYKYVPSIIIKKIEPQHFFKTSVLTDSLENKLGKSAIFLSKRHAEATSTIYVIMEQEINWGIDNNEIDFLNEKFIITDKNILKLLDGCFEILESLLIDEMVNSIWRISNEIENRLASHRHSISKLSPYNSLIKTETKLLSLSKKLLFLDEINEIMSYLNDAKKSYELLELFLHIIFESSKKNKLNGYTIEEMLNLLNYYSRKNEPYQVPHIITKDLDIQPKYYESEAQDVFIVLWNLWHNAKVHSYSIRPQISLRSTNNHLFLCILSGGRMEEKNIKKLKEPYISKIPPKKGLEIVNKYCQKLNWEITSVKTGNSITNRGYTKIEIKISKK